MDTKEQKIIFKDPNGNKMLEKDFNSKVLELAEKGLSTTEFETELKKIQIELRKKYSTQK